MFDALLVVSFGGPEAPDDVMPFLDNVTRGRGVPAERLREVAAHYFEMGGVSPINGHCRQLIAALRTELDAHRIDLPIYWGNRNWHPFLVDTIDEMRRDGVTNALAFITSPYSSYSTCRQYLDDIDGARRAIGAGAPSVQRLRHYFNHPGFIEPFARDLARVLARPDRPRPHLLFSAHSLPRAQARTCDYERQIGEASRLVAQRAGTDSPWEVVWQSRSGPPAVPWLQPELLTRLDELADRGTREIVAVPIGFISDHMEVVYDLDVQAAQHAAQRGLLWRRVATPGTSPEFVAMIRELVEERLRPGPPVRTLGELGPRPDCAPTCCPATVRPG